METEELNVTDYPDPSDLGGPLGFARLSIFWSEGGRNPKDSENEYPVWPIDFDLTRDGSRVEFSEIEGEDCIN